MGLVAEATGPIALASWGTKSVGFHNLGAECKEQGIAVRCRLRGVPRTDVATGTGDVLNIKLLSEPFAQFLNYNTREKYP